jgi:1,3-beta-glucanosyltransferase GAS1
MGVMVVNPAPMDPTSHADTISGLVNVTGTQVTPLPDFTSYSSQIAKITPSSTYASNYVITNSFTTSCPTLAAFSASPTLPPVVNQNVCLCMMNSLSCIAKEGLNSTTELSALQGICGSDSGECPALHGDGQNGTYGAFSMCNVTQRLSWALNRQHGESFTSCGSDPNAQIQNSDYFQEGQCAEVMDEAGYEGTGTVTTFPTGTISNLSGTTTPEIVYGGGDYTDGLSRGAIAGIAVGSFVVLFASSFGVIWFCFVRRWRRQRQAQATKEDVQPESRLSDSPDERSPPGGGRPASIISDDSRENVELQPWDGSFTAAGSHSEVQSSRSEIPPYGSVSEGSTAQFYHRHHSLASSGPEIEIVNSMYPPSPMESTKELPAFRSQDQPEDKSLGSMKFLSPVVKVSHIHAAPN